MFVRDPSLFLGLVTLAVPAVAGWQVYASLQRVGFRYKRGLALLLPAMWWEAYFREYARVRSEFGWPAWPLYASVVCVFIGVPLVIVGILKL